MIKRFFVLLIVLVSITACQTKPDPATVNAVSNYYAQSVVVNRSLRFSTGVKSLGDESSEVLAQKFSDQVKARVTAELPNLMTGQKPARLVILLDKASIASGVGRVALASDSYVSGVVSIVDVDTNATIAAHKIRGEDRGSNNGSSINGIPVGLIYSAIKNVSTAKTDKRIDLIVTSFSNNLKKWLKNAR
jgi:hypothetical protein